MNFAQRILWRACEFRQCKNPTVALHWKSHFKYWIGIKNRNLSTFKVSKDIEFLANASSVTPGNFHQTPLKNMKYYANLYLNQGFDVITVRINPWQLLFPLTGSQVVAKDLIQFLTQNTQHESIIIHGFSVGGHVFGDVLALMEHDLKKNQGTIDRIAGQIWDSVVYFEITEGNRRLSQTLFTNTILRKSFEKYLGFHFHVFYNVGTKHYLKAASCFVETLVRSPALFYCSEDDSMGNLEAIQKVIQKWEDMGIPVRLKCWKSSPHVGHLQQYPEEYKQEMKIFLEKLGLLRFPEKFN